MKQVLSNNQNFIATCAKESQNVWRIQRVKTGIQAGIADCSRATFIPFSDGTFTSSHMREIADLIEEIKFKLETNTLG